MTGDSEHNLLGSFDEHWDDYRTQFKAGRREISEETIHDLRVSARRLQAMLSILRSLDGRTRIKKMQRFLRKQLGEMDDLHDAQVMMEEADKSIGSMAQLIPFRDYLQDRSQDLARAGRKDLRRLKPSDVRARIEKLRKGVKRHSDDPDLVERLLQAVDGAHAKVLQRFAKLDAEDPNTIHRTRIAFKKFRYMIEVVQPFLPDYPGDYSDRMHEYQDAMGKIHDTTVFLDTLREFELDNQQRHRGQKPEVDLKPAEQFFRARLADLIVACFQRKDDFYTFWRSAPDQPFPWEKSHDALHRTTRDRGSTGPGQQRAAGQRAPSHRRRAKEVPEDRTGSGQPGDPDRPYTDQSIPTGS